MAYRRTEDDLRRAAEIQFQALKLSAEAFDNGLRGEAARLANAVFILVGRGMRNHTSILDAASQQSIRQFRTTVEDPEVAGSPLILAELKKISENEWDISLKPIGPTALEHGRALDFDDWWSEAVFKTDGNTLSRSDVVRILRDKDGGAHFDAVVEDELVAAALRGEVGGIYYSPSADSEHIPVPGALECCMRQITSELFLTMQNAGAY